MINTFFNLLYKTLDIYYYLIIIRIVLSWFPINRSIRFFNILLQITDPYLNLFNYIFPPIGGLNINSILALFTLNIIKNIISNIQFKILLKLYR